MDNRPPTQVTGRSPRVMAIASIIALTCCLPGCARPLQTQDFELARALINADMPLPDDAAASLQYVALTLCDEEVPCVEAWDSDVGLFLRFETVEAAEAYTAEAEDARQDRFVVADFSGVDLSNAARAQTEGIFFTQMPEEGGPFSLISGW